MSTPATVQHRRDTAANFTATNPLLAAGELAVELNTGLTKVGDGTTLWNSLPYTGVTPNSSSGNLQALAAALAPYLSLSPPTLITSGLIDYWKGNNSSFYSDASATTVQNTNGSNVAAWKGSINNIKLKNTYGQWIPKLVLNGVSSGVSAVDLTAYPAFLLSDAIGPISRNNFSVIIAVKKVNRIGYSLVSLDTVAGDYTSGLLMLSDGLGYPRLAEVGLQSRMTYPLNTWTIIGYTCSGSTRQLYVNGKTYVNTPTTIGGVESEVTINGLGIGWCAGSSQPATGYMAAIASYNRALSASEVQQNTLAIATELGISITSTPVDNVVFSGTSIEMGYNSNTFGYVPQSAINAGVSLFDVKNFGDSGYTTTLLYNRDVANNLPTVLKNTSVPMSKHLVMLDGITNALGSGVSAAQALSDHASLVALWAAAGWKTATRTVLDRTSPFSGGVTSASFLAAQNTVNAALLANAGGIYGQFIWNLTSVRTAGTTSDGVHPSQAGHDTIATAVGPLLSAALSA